MMNYDEGIRTGYNKAVLVRTAHPTGLSMPEATKRHYITERKLRPISRINGQDKQMDVFGAVLSRR